MARTPKNLSAGTIAATTLTQIYAAPEGNNTPIRVLTLTNNTANAITVDVYTSYSSTDYLYAKVAIPSGIGRTLRYWDLDGHIVNATETIKLQATTADSFNYTLSGTEASL